MLEVTYASKGSPKWENLRSFRSLPGTDGLSSLLHRENNNQSRRLRKDLLAHIEEKNFWLVVCTFEGEPNYLIKGLQNNQEIRTY